MHEDCGVERHTMFLFERAQFRQSWLVVIFDAIRITKPFKQNSLKVKFNSRKH